MKDLSLQNCRLDGRYDIRDRLGRGSYAEIYVAQDSLASPQSAHKSVVIKALNVFMQNDLDLDLERTLVENFQNEAIALDRVRHPNVISRLGHGTAKDFRGTVFHYLVLEYLPGGDLAKFCRKKSLELHQALNYLEQVCAGLSHAHKNDIIHRDIKPQNLLLTANHKIVKIADFGVARVTQSDSPITRVGTNIYAPPEHSPLMSGDTGSLNYSKLTPAADIYSLAKSAYVLITNESPRFFANQPITELPHSVRNRSWAPELLQILTRATQNDPRNRYQDVNEFWKELAKLYVLDDSQSYEIATQVSVKPHTIPQPQIAKGYTPFAPQQPEFNTSKELRLKTKTAQLDSSLVVKINNNPLIEPPKYQPPMPIQPNNIEVENFNEEIPQQKPKRKFFKLTATFLILIGLFAVSLYGTYNYLISRNVISSSAKMATAKTNINLRSVPTSKNNSPIGLITQNSRVRILQEQNGWFEVVIVEQGRETDNPQNAKQGWAYGTFFNLDN